MRTILLILMLTVAASAQTQSVQNGTDQIWIDDRRAEDLSKPELICALYSLWYHQQQMTCYQAKSMYGREMPSGWCGEALKAKAEACKLTQ